LTPHRASSTLLGYTDTEFDDLAASGLIGTTYPRAD
jgi:hypothetical protein